MIIILNCADLLLTILRSNLLWFLYFGFCFNEFLKIPLLPFCILTNVLLARVESMWKFTIESKIKLRI